MKASVKIVRAQTQSPAAIPARAKVRISRERARQLTQETLENYRAFDMSSPMKYAAP